MQRRLSRFRVQGLFGLYDHDIPLNREARVTSIIGPNGVGKTICLKLIDALFNRKYSIFYSTKFASCRYDFDDSTSIIVAKLAQQLDLANRGDEEASSEVSVQIISPNGEITRWEPSEHFKKFAKSASEFGHYIPFITQIAPHVWRHIRTGERLGIYDLVERFGHRLPRSLMNRWAKEETSALTDALKGLKCHLIETQRLLVLPDIDDEEFAYGRRPVEAATQLAVERKSQTLSSQIQSVLTNYASLSQSLDRTFPSRIVRAPSAKSFDRKEIEAQLGELESRRRALESAGILEPETESVTRVPENMDNALQRVISIYVTDTTQKLGIFSNLQNKIQVFEELIKKRFVDKRISISKSDGLIVISSEGRPIPLSALSSGEQHQLVLIFELLFETNTGDLILIDEPELSLHVAWQKSFVDDLLKIIKANPFDAVIATHSPVLIGHHYRLAVELGERPHDQGH